MNQSCPVFLTTIRKLYKDANFTASEISWAYSASTAYDGNRVDIFHVPNKPVWRYPAGWSLSQNSLSDWTRTESQLDEDVLRLQGDKGSIAAISRPLIEVFNVDQGIIFQQVIFDGKQRQCWDVDEKDASDVSGKDRKSPDWSNKQRSFFVTIFIILINYLLIWRLHYQVSLSFRSKKKRICHIHL